MKSLDRSVWRNRHLSLATKLRAYNSFVLPVLLYGSETWTCTKELRRRLDAFGTRSLRRILGIRWSDFVTNQWILETTRQRPVSALVSERQVRYFGHVARMSPREPTSRILRATPRRGWRRPRGRPRARWSDQIIRLSGQGTLSRALDAAQDRVLWRDVVCAATR